MNTRTITRVVGAAVAVTALTAASACGSDAQEDQGQAGGGGTLTVFAAASLTGTFQELEKRFEQANPGTDVTLNFGGSSTLAQQINQGAPADVFASADEKNMTKVTEPGNTQGEPAIFATNTLQIATAPGDPKGIKGIEDLARPDIRTVLCAPQVPCGSATQSVEKAAGVDIAEVSQEQDVKAVLQKVVTGNADAGLVYKTDVTASNGQAAGVDFPQAADAVNRYPIAALTNAQNADAAQKWVAFVTGDDGKQVLQAAGFGTP